MAKEERVVLLIDEIDKADLEFPNDLLLELDEMRFTVMETSDEVAAFRKTPYSEAAIRLRTWDDKAKIPGLPTPSLQHFLSLIDSSMFEPT